MKILTIAASNSRNSINKQLASFAAAMVKGATIEVLDINDYEMPIFSEDREKESGQPELAHQFYAKISEADAIVISFAEHNGSYSAAFKNLFDWTSRIDMKLYQQTPTIMLATSPGPGGAARVLDQAVSAAPHFGADLKASMSIPSFYDNFNTENSQMVNTDLHQQLTEVMNHLTK